MFEGQKGTAKAGICGRDSRRGRLSQGEMDRVEGVQHLEMALTPTFSLWERGKKGSLSRQ
jgi:hypothetical protein